MRQLSITGAAVVKQTIDFNSFANVKNDRDESRMVSGRSLQVHGPAMANDLSVSPKTEVCVRGARSFPLSADLIPVG